MSVTKSFAAIALATITFACGASATSDGTQGDASSDNVGIVGTRAPCQSNADCAKTQELCGYPIAEGCGAAGVCLKRDPGSIGISCASKTVCGCDGKTAGLNNECPYPSGYGSIPYSGTGPCTTDGGVEGE